MRILILPALLVAAAGLSGCERNRGTSGDRAEISPRPGARDDITVDLGGSARSALRIEGSVSRLENGFLVTEVKVRNTLSRNFPCEWRTVFQDKDGFDLPVTSNPWSPVIVNSNETVSLAKTAPVPGAVKATFYVREASPIRK